MWPKLIEIFGLPVYSYGLMMGLAFLVGLQLATRRGEAIGIEEHHVVRVVMIALIGGILGARLTFVLVDNPVYYFNRPLDILKLRQGGLVFYGGLIVAALGIIVYSRMHKLGVLRVLDLSAAPIALGHAMGRIGCFLAGCCYGKACELPWAVTFTHPEGIGLKHVPLHPTQIYSALSLVGLYFLLITMKKFSRFHGQVVLVYFIFYASIRPIIETFRSDHRGEWLGLSTSQWISIPVGLIAFGILMHMLRKRRLLTAASS